MKAFILAGGFGTRLAHVVPNVPKPMAPVSGRPFLEYIVDYLNRSGVDSITMLTGHKASVISAYFGDGRAFGVPIGYSVEDRPLGTGGAIARALRAGISEREPVFVVNGDTFFDVELRSLVDFHKRHDAAMAISLKLMDHTDRYGSVTLENSRVTVFREKSPSLGEGYINGGAYLVDRRILDFCPEAESFSFEAEVMPRALSAGAIAGLPFGGRIIDIGVPEDYTLAQSLLPRWVVAEKRRAAFLDRDGTLVEDPGHVHRIEDLRVKKGAIPLLEGLSSAGYDLFIVTNQAGIAKGLYSEEDACAFNAALVERLGEWGLRIVDCAYCPFHEEGVLGAYRRSSLRRKPSPGMLLDLADRYSIDLSRSVMIGDSPGDRIELAYLRSFVLGEDGDYQRILEVIIDAA